MDGLIDAAAGWTALSGFGVMTRFQAGPAAGMPWGRAARGGRHQTLPLSLRLGSLLAAVIYILGILMVMERSGMLGVWEQPDIIQAGFWILAGIFGLSFIGNLLSCSGVEKAIMLPVSLALSASCLILAW